MYIIIWSRKPTLKDSRNQIHTNYWHVVGFLFVCLFWGGGWCFLLLFLFLAAHEACEWCWARDRIQAAAVATVAMPEDPQSTLLSQELNPSLSSDPSHCRDKARALTYCTIAGSLEQFVVLTNLTPVWRLWASAGQTL